MSKKVYVGGLAWATTDDSLKSAFAEFGTVEDAIVIKHHDTGKSKGFGFVTFSSTDEASAAIDGMNGQSIDGRTVNVDVAHDKR